MKELGRGKISVGVEDIEYGEGRTLRRMAVMNKLKWEFELRQHTPMIHFQPTDSGVCLRATEVKPKFDRFLLENKDFTESQIKKWFYIAEDGQLASQIKMRFRAEGEMARSYTYEKKQGIKIPRGSIDTINPLYFGNLGCTAREDVKETIFYQNGLKGTVICFDEEFLEIVKEYIPAFFLFHNFGTRQNKGFGSFSVSGKCRVECIMDVVQKYMPNAFYLDYQTLGKGQGASAEERLNDIGIIYSLIKGGIYLNKEHYYKSALLRYYQERGIAHEKKVIEQCLFGEERKENIHNPHFVRAVLGLTDSYSYRDDLRKGKVLVSNDDIKRYQSPIYFKVLGRYTLLFLSPLPEALKNAEFKFTLRKKEGVRSVKLTVPDFDIDDFMEWFADDFNHKDEIMKQGAEKPIRGSLKAAGNREFRRIEQLKLQRCRE